MLRFDRKQQNSVKQLSFNKKERKKRLLGELREGGSRIVGKSVSFGMRPSLGLVTKFT